jgi:hypothetical protein
VVELRPKSSFDDFVSTCTPLLKIPELEEQMRARVREIVAELLNFQPDADPAKNLRQFLQKDKDFLGVLLAITNLSQEKFLRILSAKRFANGDFGREWDAERVYRKIRTDDTFAETIAGLFLEGRDNRLLVEQVADFYLDQLSLPANWPEFIRDQNIVANVVRKKLTGEYTDQKGECIERIVRGVLDGVGGRHGIAHTRGQVSFLAKQVDHVIPSLENPYIMVMVSYMETTSSGQTARANEQQGMCEKVVGENTRWAPRKCVFVNIVDGAGWLARRSDLRKMHAGCDYCLNMKTLDQLEAIICRYVPERYFQNPPS